MKKIFKTALTSLLISSFALTSVGFTSVEQTNKKGISQIIAFGDSCSDNGEAYSISKAILENPEINEGAYIKPGELYWENRYSNGKTAVEVLAEKLDTPLTNYATGGATSGYENYSTWMDRLGYTGVLGQVAKYEKSLNGKKADPNALHFILVGANDYSYFVDYALDGTVEGVADQVVENIETAIKELSALGAKKFFIVNSIDLTLTPYEISEGRTEIAATFTNHMNTALPNVLKTLKKNLKIDITDFDIAKVMNEIATNPENYGIKYVGVECQATYPEIKPAKPNADEYFSWDEWHFSRVTHRAIGEAMYSTAKTIK